MFQKFRRKFYEKKYSSFEKIEKRKRCLQEKQSDVSRIVLRKYALFFFISIVLSIVTFLRMIFHFYSLPVSLVSVVVQFFSVGCITKLQDEKQAISFFSKRYAQELEELERLEQQYTFPLQKSMTPDLEKEILSTIEKYHSQVPGHDRLLWEKYYFLLCYEKQKRVDQGNCIATEPIILDSFEELISKGISRKKLK